MCHFFPEFGKHGGHFLPRCHRALQAWNRRTPPRSRDPHVWCIWTVLILDFLRQGHWSMGIYLLWMVTSSFRPGEPLSIQTSKFLYRESAPVITPTAEVQNIYGQRHGRVVLSLVRELALDGNSSQPWKHHRMHFNFSYHDFSVVWNKVIEATRLGDFIQPLVPYMAQHSGPSIDAALGTRTRKEIKDRGRLKSDRIVLRYEERARLHKSFHRLPAAYRACALQCEQHAAKFSHPASAPSSAMLSFPGKLETDTPSLLTSEHPILG